MVEYLDSKRQRGQRQRLVRLLAEEGIQNQAVLKAMLAVPRHLFINEALSAHAYDNTALPIGKKQTISQPYIVARMTELVLQTQPKKVLEIGTGSGYQAAILAHLVDQVYSVERIQSLLAQAQQRLQQLHLTVHAFHRDGYAGLPEYAPFDAILVTAAPPGIPRQLVHQLKIGGRMILPVGEDQRQALYEVVRSSQDEYQSHFIEWVRFVPLLAGVEA